MIGRLLTGGVEKLRQQEEVVHLLLRHLRKLHTLQHHRQLWWRQPGDHLYLAGDHLLLFNSWQAEQCLLTTAATSFYYRGKVRRQKRPLCTEGTTNWEGNKSRILGSLQGKNYTCLRRSDVYTLVTE